MTIEVSREVETQLLATAQAEGMTVGQCVEQMVAENNLRRKHLMEFRTAIAERMASLNAGQVADGEEVLASLIAAVPER